MPELKQMSAGITLPSPPPEPARNEMRRLTSQACQVTSSEELETRQNAAVRECATMDGGSSGSQTAQRSFAAALLHGSTVSPSQQQSKSA